MKKRKDIDKKYKWDLSNFFENDLKWQEAFEKFSLKIGEIAKYNGKLKTEQQIYDCLFLLETLDLMAEPLYIYAHCYKDLDVTNSASQEKMSKLESKLTEQSVASSFITLFSSKLP